VDPYFIKRPKLANIPIALVVSNVIEVPLIFVLKKEPALYELARIEMCKHNNIKFSETPH